jgi:zinc D-Ala-D-Ala carboxypeptidase
MNLTEHFTLAEFTRSDTATRLGIRNEPDAAQLANLTRLAQMLEIVRALLNDQPIIISSGLRVAALNRAVGGVQNSDHVEGRGVDFGAPGFGSALAVCEAIAASPIDFDQLIFERTWTHFSIAPLGTQPRRQILTAHFGKGPTRYTNGLP